MKKIFTWLAFRKKALCAGIVAFGGAFSLALDDNAVSLKEWVAIIIATVVGYSGTYAAENSPTDGLDK